MIMEETQREKFERLARELECDEDEARFNEKLKRIAREGGRKGEAEKTDKPEK